MIDLCTIDACVKGECVHTTNGSDGDPCTDDICEPTTGIWSHFPSDTQECTQILCWGLTPEEAHGKCFDNNLCTYEACSFGDQPFSPMAKPLPPIIPGQPLPPGVYLCQIVDKICIDIDPCTIDLCEPESGCLSEPNFDDPECHCDSDVDCEDNNSCTLESCDVAVEICVYSPLDCEDGNFCTIDTCYPDSGCHYEQADLPDECYDG